jgi:hypothetical protein
VANLIQTAKMTARLAQTTNLIQASNLTTRLTQATNLSRAAKPTARLALVENLIQAVKLYARVASLANLTPYARLASPHDSANFWPQSAMAARSTSPLAMGSSLGVAAQSTTGGCGTKRQPASDLREYLTRKYSLHEMSPVAIAKD